MVFVSFLFVFHNFVFMYFVSLLCILRDKTSFLKNKKIYYVRFYIYSVFKCLLFQHQKTKAKNSRRTQSKPRKQRTRNQRLTGSNEQTRTKTRTAVNL